MPAETPDVDTELELEEPDDLDVSEFLSNDPLVRFLGSKAANEILVAIELAANDLSTTHIVEKTDRDRRTVLRYLQAFDALGLVDKREAGNTHLYSLSDSEAAEAWSALRSHLLDDYEPENETPADF